MSPTTSASSIEPRRRARASRPTPNAPCSHTSGGRSSAPTPLTGVGWQASSLPESFGPHLAAARDRFPDVPAAAFPSESRLWGVQNAYVQAAADMGIVGLLVLLVAIGSAFLRSIWRGIRGSDPPDPLAPTLAVAILVGAAVWAALGLVPGVPATALLWLAIGGAVALPRGGALPDDAPAGT